MAKGGGVGIGGGNGGYRAGEATGGEGFANGKGVAEWALVTGGGDKGEFLLPVVVELGGNAVHAPLQRGVDRGSGAGRGAALLRPKMGRRVGEDWGEGGP